MPTLGLVPKPATASGAVRATVVFALACLACFIVLVTWVLLQAHADSVSRAETRARAYSQVVAANAALLVEGIYQALQRMDLALGNSLTSTSPEAVQDLDDAVANLPKDVRAWIIDANGAPKHSNTNLSQDFSVADRDYFVGIKNGSAFRISPLMVSRTAGDPVVAIAKRIERQERFVGAAVIIVPADFLDRFRGALTLGPDSTLGLIRSDGQLVTRSPIPPEPQDLSGYVLFTDYLPKADEGAYFAESPTDGIHRIVGFRRVPGYPLVAVASIAMSEAMAGFWGTLATVMAFSVPGLVGLGVFALWTIRSQRELATASAEKEVLLREIHHRVKNNLQQVLSLIAFQRVPEDTRRELERRIGAMVAVHEQMYRSEDMLRVDLADFLPRLLDGVRQSFARQVAVSFNLVPFNIDRERAQPLALIVSEVVSNAIKHAWPEGADDPRIDISLVALSNDRALLTIHDNGVGFDLSQKYTGMGQRLIRGLVSQLGGKGHYEINGGTAYRLEFSAAFDESPGP